jgi:hypothetical protein
MRTETESLSAIAHQLERLAEALTPSKQLLGFGPAPKSQVYVFCNRTKGGIWYSLDGDGNPINIDHQALTGYIRKLEFVKAQRRGEQVSKLHCTIEADRTYILESSYDSNFSKGLLCAITALTPDQLKQPITIVPQPSSQAPEVLFCNIYQEEKQIFSSFDKQTDWRTVSRTALLNVRRATGESEENPVATAA